MVRALCSHRRGRGFEPLYLYHRFEQRLEAIQKNREFGTNAAPCFLFRSLPCSPLRADIRKRNCDGSRGSPIPSLRSLRLSAKRQLSRSCYHFIIDVSTVKRSPSTTASSNGLKRSKKREFGTSATPFFLSRILPCSSLRADIRKRNCDARQASLFRHYAIASFLTAVREAAAFAKLLPFYNRCIYCEAKPLYQRFEQRLEAIQKMGVWHKCHSLFLVLAKE